MTLKITRMHVWATEIDDQPGGLANVLDAVADAGASLECLIARRKADKPGTGVVFITPLKGKRVLAAAAAKGFRETQRVATLKVEGGDVPGLGAKLTRAVGDAGVSLRGVSAAVVGKKFACYLGFDSEADADRALKGLKAMARKK